MKVPTPTSTAEEVKLTPKQTQLDNIKIIKVDDKCDFLNRQ